MTSNYLPGYWQCDFLKDDPLWNEENKERVDRWRQSKALGYCSWVLGTLLAGCVLALWTPLMLVSVFDSWDNIFSLNFDLNRIPFYALMIVLLIVIRLVILITVLLYIEPTKQYIFKKKAVILELFLYASTLAFGAVLPFTFEIIGYVTSYIYLNNANSL